MDANKQTVAMQQDKSHVKLKPRPIVSMNLTSCYAKMLLKTYISRSVFVNMLGVIHQLSELKRMKFQ